MLHMVLKKESLTRMKALCLSLAFTLMSLSLVFSGNNVERTKSLCGYQLRF